MSDADAQDDDVYVRPTSAEYRDPEDPFRLLRVWPEYGSLGIWEINEPRQMTAGFPVKLDALSLSEDLKDAFRDWMAWFDEADPSDPCDPFDWESFNDAGIALARRLRKELPPLFYLEFLHGKVHVVIDE